MKRAQNSEHHNVIGQRLKSLRELRGLSQRQLAKQAHIPSSLVSQIETGVRSGEGMTVYVARRIAYVLGVTLDRLVDAPMDDMERDREPATVELVAP